MPTETGKGYLSGNLCGFKLQSTEAIKMNVDEAFIDYFMFFIGLILYGRREEEG